MAPETDCWALKAVKKYQKIRSPATQETNLGTIQTPLPPPSKRRRVDSLTERPIEATTLQEIAQPNGAPDLPDTFFYLAYGSNLCAQTFQGKRGIRPLSQMNVLVPELVMTFDLAGVPYLEPCFANTRYRNTTLPEDPPSSEKTSLLSPPAPAYHKTRWNKGLVGVVYEVTQKDYAHIIATEGGGASYQDILVSCYELPTHEPIVPDHPISAPFKAHTLFSPVYPPSTKPPQTGGQPSRPDPDYAQPSARYLKLIHDGADEHGLPEEYKSYLHQLRPYTVTTRAQKMGRWLVMTFWLPFIYLVFGLNKRFAGRDGRAPPWLIFATSAVFKGLWVAYDAVLYRVFGDGERTVCDEGAEVEGRGAEMGYEWVEEKGVDEDHRKDGV